MTWKLVFLFILVWVEIDHFCWFNYSANHLLVHYFLVRTVDNSWTNLACRLPLTCNSIDPSFIISRSTFERKQNRIFYFVLTRSHLGPTSFSLWMAFSEESQASMSFLASLEFPHAITPVSSQLNAALKQFCIHGCALHTFFRFTHYSVLDNCGMGFCQSRFWFVHLLWWFVDFIQRLPKGARRFVGNR